MAVSVTSINFSVTSRIQTQFQESITNKIESRMSIGILTVCLPINTSCYSHRERFP